MPLRHNFDFSRDVRLHSLSYNFLGSPKSFNLNGCARTTGISRPRAGTDVSAISLVPQNFRSATAKIIYVAQSGSPSTPCGDTKSSPCSADFALGSLATSGDRILFLPGNYSFASQLASKNIDLAAESSEVEISPNVATGSPTLIVRSSRISIQGFRFIGFHTTAIAITDAESEIFVDGCTFRDFIIQKAADPNIIKFNGMAGGAIYSAGSALHISNSLFTNMIISVAGPVVAGGAVAVISDSCYDKALNVSFTNTKFEGVLPVAISHLLFVASTN